MFPTTSFSAELKSLSRGGQSRGNSLTDAASYPPGHFVRRLCVSRARAIDSSQTAGVVLYPEVDIERFQPPQPEVRNEYRTRLQTLEETQLVVGVAARALKRFRHADQSSRADGAESPHLQVLIAGSGRDSKRLQKIIDTTSAPVELLGRVSMKSYPCSGAADVGAMLCRDRWLGLEQEGFGAGLASCSLRYAPACRPQRRQ